MRARKNKMFFKYRITIELKILFLINKPPRQVFPRVVYLVY